MLIINEIKKIFKVKMLCFLIIGSFVFYEVFIAFHVKVFPNGILETNEYNIMVEMINNYGNEMNSKEFEDFKAIYKEMIIKADGFLSNNKDFNELGIYSYEDYLNISNMHGYDDFQKKAFSLKQDYLESEEGKILLNLHSFEYIIWCYEDKEDYTKVSLDEAKYKIRTDEINRNKENESIISRVVFDNYNDLIIRFGVAISMAIAFMLTPIFLRDRKEKLEYIQYSSKCGRNLFKVKLRAGFISAFIITTIGIISLLLLYSLNNTSMFFKSNINSAFNRSYWLNLSFVEYIILTVVCTYIISSIVAFTTMFISRQAKDYVEAMELQGLVLSIIIILNIILLINKVFVMYLPKYLVISVYLFLTIVTLITTIRIGKKEKIKDVDNG